MAKTTKYSGTQTEKNLEAAFAGESQARNKYTYFASVAKKQGFEQIADGANLGSFFAYNNMTAVTTFPNLDFAPFENFCSFNIAE